MFAQAGDWLVVEKASVGSAARRGLIVAVASPIGAPPYRVRWLDTGREALVFPGPDARVMTRDELDAADARAAMRADHAQREIRARQQA